MTKQKPDEDIDPFGLNGSQPRFIRSRASKFLNGFKYQVKSDVTEDGETFEYYVIIDDEFNDFKKFAMKYKKTGTEIEKNGLLWVYREIDGFDVMSARGFGFKRFVIVQEE